jgi:ABC-type polysaccharide/polyol phosphate export permease
VWRNLIAFGHNLIIYAWVALLPGLARIRFRDIQQLVTTSLQVVLFVTRIFWN